MDTITNLKFESWEDAENGNRNYLEEFLGRLGDVRAGKVIRILSEQYPQFSFGDLMREGLISEVPGYPDLYYVRIDKKSLKVRLFGGIMGDTMWLVHGVLKRPLCDVSASHYKTAYDRIKKIKRI